MKVKILILSIFGMYLFVSCCNDDINDNQQQTLDPNTILPKKIILNENDYGLFGDYNYSVESVYEFFYNQNKINYIKLTEIDESGTPIISNINFTYNGDLISQINSVSSNNLENYTINYIYQNNNLIQINNTFVDNPQNNYTVLYTYNINGTITFTIGQYSSILTLNNELVFNDGANFYEYYYSSNSPFKNVKGIDKITLYPIESVLYKLFLFRKNLRKVRNTGNSSWDESYFYTYNDILFPTSFFIQKIDSSGLTRITNTYSIIY